MTVHHGEPGRYTSITEIAVPNGGATYYSEIADAIVPEASVQDDMDVVLSDARQLLN